MKALYVTDRLAIGEARFTNVLAALSGAAGLSVQLRERDLTDREYLELAKLARRALGEATTLYVNRRMDVALCAEADGVHLPSSGLPVARVRSAAPRGFRVGASTHSPAEAVRAIDEEADLVLLGPIFDTPSKRVFGAPLGPKVLGELPPAKEHACEVLAIGGVSEDNLDELAPYRDRIHGVAGIRLFQDASDPRAVAARIARR